MKYLIFDTETTNLLLPNVQDLSKQPHIVELGVIVVEDGKEVKRYSQLLNPGVELTPDNIKIHGITNEMIKDAPAFREVLGEFEELFVDADELICHNAPFDVGMLKVELARIGRTGFPWPERITCTVQEFRHEFGGKFPKLVNLYQIKMGKPLEQKHRAVDDCEAVLEILLQDKYFDIK